MKKLITILTIGIFMFSINVNAQEPVQAKKTVVKSEKACCSADKKAVASTDAKQASTVEAKKACCSADKKETASVEGTLPSEKKACGTEAKASCCSSKKEVAKKED